MIATWVTRTRTAQHLPSDRLTADGFDRVAAIVAGSLRPVAGLRDAGGSSAGAAASAPPAGSGAAETSIHNDAA